MVPTQDTLISLYERLVSPNTEPEFLDSAIAVGLLCASPLFIFCGNRLVRVVIVCVGFIAGGYFSEHFLFSIVLPSSLLLDRNQQLGISFAVSAFSALVVHKLFSWGIFLLGSAAGLMATSLLAQYVGQFADAEAISKPFKLVLLMVIGVLSGTVTLKLHQVLLTPLTAAFGATAFVSSIDFFRGGSLSFTNFNVVAPGLHQRLREFECEDEACNFLLVLWCCIFFAGVRFQFGCLQGKKPAKLKPEGGREKELELQLLEERVQRQNAELRALKAEMGSSNTSALSKRSCGSGSSGSGSSGSGSDGGVDSKTRRGRGGLDGNQSEELEAGDKGHPQHEQRERTGFGDFVAVYREGCCVS
jgi:hypothetical protein